MGGATGFLWLAVVILALIWALDFTGTVRMGINVGQWLPVLLVLAILGAVFNMFVMPFLGRSRTTRTSASVAGTSAPAGTMPATMAAPPVAGSTEQEVVQETRDRPSL